MARLLKRGQLIVRYDIDFALERPFSLSKMAV
jgi:hypothetical protein